MSSFSEVPASFVPQRSRGHAEVSGNHRGFGGWDGVMALPSVVAISKIGTSWDRQ